MDAEVDQCATRRTFLFREPSTAARWNTARPHPDRFGKINLSEFLIGDQFVCSPHRRCETKLSTKRINEPALLGFFLQHFHFGAV
jgi:hypothetical protein